MTGTVLKGLNGSNPLGFMASIGLLRILGRRVGSEARLGFTDDVSCHAWVEHHPSLDLAGRYVSVTLVARPRAFDVTITSHEILSYCFVEPGRLPERTYPYHAEVVQKFWAR